MSKNLIKTLDFVGRVLLSSTFFLAVPSKLFNYNIYLNLIFDKGFSILVSNVILVLSILFLTLGSVLLIEGRKQRTGIILLLMFLIPTTFVFHLSPFEPSQFYMNLGLIGGLLLALIRVKALSNSKSIITLNSIYSDLVNYVKSLLKGFT